MKKTALAALLSLAPLPLAAQGARVRETKGRLFVNGAFDVTSLDWSESRKYKEFAEESTIEAAYEASPGPGFEAGLEYTFVRRFGVAVSFASATRDESATVRSDLPHPFYFNRKRPVEGEAKGFSHKETALHFDVVYAAKAGSLGYSLFAGVSRIKVETDLVKEPLQFSQTYPYDTATLTGIPADTFEDTPTGFNVGGGLDYRIGRNFGFGAQVRFSRAKAKFTPSEGNSLEVDAGGLQVAAGARVFF